MTPQQIVKLRRLQFPQWTILFQPLLVDQELWQHATLGHFSPHHFLHRSSEPPCSVYGVQSHHISTIWCSEPSFIVWRLELSFTVWHSEPLFIVWHLEPSFTVQRSEPSFIVWHSESSFIVQRSEPAFTVWCSELSLTIWHSEPSFTVWHSEPLVSLAFKVVFFSLVFKAIPHLGVQSHFSIWHSESPSTFQVFRATFLSLGVQSHLPPLGVQSHFPQFRHSKSPCSFQAFKATLLSLGIQSHHLSIVQAFKATFLSQAFIATSPAQAFRAIFFGLGIQSNLLQLSIQSHLSHLGVQSHFAQFHFTQLRRSEPLHSFRRSKPPLLAQVSQSFLSIQVFKATILGVQAIFFLVLSIQSHFFQLRLSKPQF